MPRQWSERHIQELIKKNGIGGGGVSFNDGGTVTAKVPLFPLQHTSAFLTAKPLSIAILTVGPLMVNGDTDSYRPFACEINWADDAGANKKFTAGKFIGYHIIDKYKVDLLNENILYDVSFAKQFGEPSYKFSTAGKTGAVFKEGEGVVIDQKGANTSQNYNFIINGISQIENAVRDSNVVIIEKVTDGGEQDLTHKVEFLVDEFTENVMDINGDPIDFSPGLMYNLDGEEKYIENEWTRDVGYAYGLKASSSFEASYLKITGWFLFR